MTRLLPIVEGDGDLQAVPVLLRRVLYELHGRYDVQLLRAQKRGEWPRVKRDFERFYRSARLVNAPILWVLDFDCEGCIDHEAEATWLKAEAARIDSTGKIEVVFMVKEFESLFLWDAPATRNAFPEMSSSIDFPFDPEEVRNAKGWISEALPKGRSYKSMADQARLTDRLDLEALLQCSLSFQRFERAVHQLTT